MKKLYLAMMAALTLAFGGVTYGVTQPAYAQNCANAADCVNSGVRATGNTGSRSTDVKGVFTTVANTLLFIIGAVAVIMLIIGGIRYTVSQGDSSQVQSAKNTILYAIIGLLVAIFAFAIVNFVVTAFVK